MIILGIDAATTSGWTIIDPEEPRIIDSGLATHSAHRAVAVRAALDAGGPDLVAVEEHLFGPRKTQASLNRSTGKWLEAVESAAGIPEKAVVALSPNAWRKILGAPSRFAGRNPSERRASAKMWSICFARDRLGARERISDDEAEAACIAYAAALTKGLVCDTVIPACPSPASKSRRSGSRKKRGASTSSGTRGTTRSATKRRKTKSSTSSPTT